MIVFMYVYSLILLFLLFWMVFGDKITSEIMWMLVYKERAKKARRKPIEKTEFEELVKIAGITYKEEPGKDEH